jgi:hypothetical protein
MKYTDQNIPPHLHDHYRRLISNSSATMPSNGHARTRRAARMSQQKDRTKADDWAAVAAQAYEEIKGIPGIDTKRRFISEEKNRLRAGIFDPVYWVQLEVNNRQYLTSTPENIPDPNPPPYAYRDPENLPSIVTYPDGTPDAEPIRTSGATIDGRWHDLEMVWSKVSYQLIKNGQRPAQLPLCWTTKGTMTIDADTRASRPMLSVIAKAILTDQDYPGGDTNQPPTHPMISLYWLFKVPDTSPPYYHATIPIARKAVLNKHIDAPPGIEPARIIMLTAARPMLGIGYNNNTSVTTSYAELGQIYQLMPCLNEPPEPGGWLEIQLAWFDGTTYHFDAYAPDKTKKWPASQIAQARKKWYSLNRPPIWYQSNSSPENWIIRNTSQEPPAGYTPRGRVSYIESGLIDLGSHTIYSDINLLGRNVTEYPPKYDGFLIEFSFEGCN